MLQNNKQQQQQQKLSDQAESSASRLHQPKTAKKQTNKQKKRASITI